MNGIFCLRGTAFGISINFVNIRGLDLPQNIDKGICSGTLPNKMWKILEATVKRDGKVWILQAYFAHVIILLEQIFWQVQGIRFGATNLLPITNGSCTNLSFFGVRCFELLLSSIVQYPFAQYTSYLFYIGFFLKTPALGLKLIEEFLKIFGYFLPICFKKYCHFLLKNFFEHISSNFRTNSLSIDVICIV